NVCHLTRQSRSLLCQHSLVSHSSPPTRIELSPPPTPSLSLHDTPPTDIHTLSLHDALPISLSGPQTCLCLLAGSPELAQAHRARSEEHTSELQSQSNLVCRLLLEKKKKIDIANSMREHD